MFTVDAHPTVNLLHANQYCLLINSICHLFCTCLLGLLTVVFVYQCLFGIGYNLKYQTIFVSLTDLSHVDLNKKLT